MKVAWSTKIAAILLSSMGTIVAALTGEAIGVLIIGTIFYFFGEDDSGMLIVIYGVVMLGPMLATIAAFATARPLYRRTMSVLRAESTP